MGRRGGGKRRWGGGSKGGGGGGPKKLRTADRQRALYPSLRSDPTRNAPPKSTGRRTAEKVRLNAAAERATSTTTTTTTEKKKEDARAAEVERKRAERAEERERMKQRPDETFYEFSRRIGAETAAALDTLRTKWMHTAPDSVYVKRRAKLQRYAAERAERTHARGDADRLDREDAFSDLRDHVAFGETVLAPPKLRTTPKPAPARRPPAPEALTDVQRTARLLYRQKKQRDRRLPPRAASAADSESE
jgi:hypothetical protein